MSKKKGKGSSSNGRDSIGKRLGVKLSAGKRAKAGQVIVTQRGTAKLPGKNVILGKKHTIHAHIDGTVVYERRVGRVYVHIRPLI